MNHPSILSGQVGATRDLNPYAFAAAMNDPRYRPRTARRVHSQTPREKVEREPPAYLHQLEEAFRISGNALTEAQIRHAVGDTMGLDSITLAVSPWLLIYEDDEPAAWHHPKYHLLEKP